MKSNHHSHQKLLINSCELPRQGHDSKRPAFHGRKATSCSVTLSSSHSGLMLQPHVWGMTPMLVQIVIIVTAGSCRRFVSLLYSIYSSEFVKLECTPSLFTLSRWNNVPQTLVLSKSFSFFLLTHFLSHWSSARDGVNVAGTTFNRTKQLKGKRQIMRSWKVFRHSLGAGRLLGTLDSETSPGAYWLLKRRPRCGPWRKMPSFTLSLPPPTNHQWPGTFEQTHSDAPSPSRFYRSPKSSLFTLQLKSGP